MREHSLTLVLRLRYNQVIWTMHRKETFFSDGV